MQKFNFEKLDVYQKATRFIDRVFEVTERLPGQVQFSLGEQLRRAALSIANNIAEGSGRLGKGEKSQFFRIARSSGFECIPCLEILNKRRHISDAEFDLLYDDCFQISKMLSKLISSVH